MINYDGLWAEIDDIAHQEQMSRKQPYERSITEFKEQWKMSERRIRELLDKLVAEGKMNSREAKCLNGKITMVYSPSPAPTPK